MRRSAAVFLLSFLFGAGGASAQQTGSIVGTVTASESGQPLAGVSVFVQETGHGTLTDQNGSFLIPGLPVGTYQLGVRLIGYAEATVEAVSVSAGDPAVVEVELQSQAIELAEIVAVGYGTQRRGEVTGAVTSVSSDRFIAGPARGAASLIAGQLPGLQVVHNSGNPTSDPQIMLRGVTSIPIAGTASPNPLILIDGVPGGLNTVAVEDIESISVLKDGSAAAVYGSRASNGVILITTKRHGGGSATFRYSGYTSFSSIYNRPDFMDADDWRSLRSMWREDSIAGVPEVDRRGVNFTIIGEDANGQDPGYSTDWMKQLLRSPISHRHNLTATGGDVNTHYTASLNWEDTQGILRRSDNRELIARANVGHSMFDGRFRADVNFLSRTQNHFRGLTPNQYNGAWRQAVIRNPTDRVTDDDGRWVHTPGYMYNNPLAIIDEVDGERESRTTRLHSTLTLQPISNLDISLMGGVARGGYIEGTSRTFEHISSIEGGEQGFARRATESSIDRVLELTGQYFHSLGAHNFTLLGGYSYNDFVEETFNVQNCLFDTDLYGYAAPGVGDGFLEQHSCTGVGGGKEDRKTIGFFSRLNYSWDNRFNLMGSVRYEGDSRFGANHQWGMFPAVSAGWRLSEEAFLRDVGFLDDLRVRVGYGVTGMAPENPYGSLASYSFSGQRFLYNGNWIRTLGPTRNPNPDLRWERKEEVNVGLDFSVLARLSGTLDVYRRDNKDMLYNYAVPSPPFPVTNMLANVGHMRNQGIEAVLSYDVINRPGLQWNTSVNWSRNTNTLVSISDAVYEAPNFRYDGHTGEPIQIVTHRTDVGGPIGNFYGFKSVDIDENGVWIVERPAQYDDDGNLTSGAEHISILNATLDNDRQVLGNGIPKHFAAWNNMARFGNFDLSVNMRGAFGFQILNFQRLYYENTSIYHYNMLRSALEPVYGRTKPNGEPVTVNYDLSYVSYYVEDGDYWKIDNATLGYTVSPRMLGSLSNVVSNARVYLSGRNLLTITGYKGVDPEVNINGLAPGTDHRDQYPTTRMFTVGVNFTF